MQFRESVYYVGSMGIEALSSTRWGTKTYRVLVKIIDVLTPAPLNRLTGLRKMADLTWAATMVVAFGVTATWSLATGRWAADANPMTRNFAEDIPNVINYLIICPGYVTFGVLYIVTIGRAFAESQRVFDLREQVSQPRRGFGLIVTVAFVAILSGVLVANFGLEALTYSSRYWYADEVRGVRIYSALGYYYILVNFSLNVIVMISGVYAFKMWSVAWSVEKAARAVAEGSSPDLFDEDTVMSELRVFALAYTYFKWFLFFLYINAFTWARDEPGGTRLLLTASAALFISVLVLVSLPKYHVQYWIHKAFAATQRDEYLDIRTIRERVACSMVDVVILGSGLLNLAVAFAPSLKRFLT